MPPQPAASSSDPIPGLGFVSLKAAVLRAVLAQENLSLHSKKRPTPCFSPCKCTVTTCEVTGCYWLQAQLEPVRSCSPGQGLKAGVPRLSSPACQSCPWIPPQSTKDWPFVPAEAAVTPPHPLSEPRNICLEHQAQSLAWKSWSQFFWWRTKGNDLIPV